MMNSDIIKSLDLMGKGMTAIFVVIIVIYLSVNLMLRLTEGKKNEKEK